MGASRLNIYCAFFSLVAYPKVKLGHSCPLTICMPRPELHLTLSDVNLASHQHVASMESGGYTQRLEAPIPQPMVLCGEDIDSPQDLWAHCSVSTTSPLSCYIDPKLLYLLICCTRECPFSRHMPGPRPNERRMPEMLTLADAQLTRGLGAVITRAILRLNTIHIDARQKRRFVISFRNEHTAAAFVR
jgi:hypothetical protein